MKKKVGLWIDHKKAVIFILADEGAKIKRIASESKSDSRSSGDLKSYFDEVLSYVHDADSILIFGPDEAKLELKKRLENMELHGHIVGIETVKTMSDNQIVSKIRHRFLQ